MSLILSGTDGLSDVDGSAATPAIRGTDANTGMFFPAADTIAFSEGGVESMRIDSSGRLGIGTTSPTQQLDVTATSSSTAIIVAQNTTATSGGAQIRAGNPQNLFIIGTDSNGGGLSGTANSSFFYTTSTSPIVFMPNATERMRIDSSGNVGIGVTTIATPSSSRRGLQVSNSTSGGALYLSSDSTETNNPRIFGAGTTQYDLGLAAGGSTGYINYYTNGTERMRILSGGSVCVNTTAAVVDSTSRLIVSTTTTNGVAGEFSNSTSGTCALAVNNSGAATSTLINWIAAGSYRAAVTWNGTNIIYGTPSDQRLKENIVDSTSALPLINNIKIRSFDFKENGKHIDFGVIAQELVSVVPESVLKGKDNEDGSIKESWSVDTSTLVPALIKAIQEQQAMIENLQAEVALLKSK
jgi:hypothetical protein